MLKIKKPTSNGKQIWLLCGFVLFLILFVMFHDHPTTKQLLSSTKDSFSSMFSDKLDYSHLINITFTFKMLPLICSEEEKLIILVHSAPHNFNNRKVIRETWGQSNEGPRPLFFMGSVEDETTQRKLEEENEQHKDLVQGNFFDSYHNLTYKHVMALKYIVYHCPRVDFMLKVDDDVFINTPALKMFVDSYLCHYGRPTQIFCSVLRNPPVLRSGKWETSLEDYPEENYPSHCGGFAILYPRDIIFPLYAEAQRAKFFWVDDVFVSGICAKKLNITHISIEQLVLTNDDVHQIVDLSFTNITKPFLVGRINLDEHQIRSLWSFVSNNLPKTILDYLRYD